MARIYHGYDKELRLGNLNAKRDWGYAGDYVEAMWLMLQQDKPDDYVIGTGESHSVREFVNLAFRYAGIELDWQGKGTGEKGVVSSAKSDLNSNVKVGDVLIEIDPRYFRPTEVDFLLADPSKAKANIGWEPKVIFTELAKIMVDADMREIDLVPPGEGDQILKTLFPDRWWKTD